MGSLEIKLYGEKTRIWGGSREAMEGCPKQALCNGYVATYGVISTVGQIRIDMKRGKEGRERFSSNTITYTILLREQLTDLLHKELVRVTP